MGEVIGLIAGSGRFPILFAKEARRQGLRVAAVALAGVTDPALKDEVDSWAPLSWARSSLCVLKEAGAKKAVMAIGSSMSPLRGHSGSARRAHGGAQG